MKKIIAVMLFFCVFIAHAQDNEETRETLEEIVARQNENKNFIQLKTGAIFYFNSYIEKTQPFLGSSKLKVEGNEYDLDDVESYKVGTQFYKSTDAVFGACTSFAERIDVGKINIYKSYHTVYNAGAPMMGVGGGMMMTYGGGASTKEVYYYNKGNFPLKSMTYDNLVDDLVENQESMILLQTYKKAKNKEILWYVIGGAAAIGGILTAGEKTGDTVTEFDPQFGLQEKDEVGLKPLNFGIAVGGLITIAINYLANRDNPNYLQEAIHKYNHM